MKKIVTIIGASPIPVSLKAIIQVTVAKLARDVSPPLEWSGEALFRGVRGGSSLVPITGYRRQNFGQGSLNTCEAIKELAETFPNVDFV